MRSSADHLRMTCQTTERGDLCCAAFMAWRSLRCYCSSVERESEPGAEEDSRASSAAVLRSVLAQAAARTAEAGVASCYWRDGGRSARWPIDLLRRGCGSQARSPVAPEFRPRQKRDREEQRACLCFIAEAPYDDSLTAESRSLEFSFLDAGFVQLCGPADDVRARRWPRR
jgi:hypothetical protein